MSDDFDAPDAADRASAKLQEELATAQPGAYNRLKVNVSHLVNKCTFGKYGQNKNEGKCPFSK